MNNGYIPESRDQRLFKFILQTAQKYWKDSRILLFGSRTRGDAKPMSDYDFAVIAPNALHQEWALFDLEVKEHAPTLLPIDLVWVNQIDEAFKSRILLEGIPLTQLMTT